MSVHSQDNVKEVPQKKVWNTVGGMSLVLFAILLGVSLGHVIAATGILPTPEPFGVQNVQIDDHKTCPGTTETYDGTAFIITMPSDCFTTPVFLPSNVE